MEVVVNYKDKEYCYDVNEESTGRDVRRFFQKDCNIGNGEYRLICTFSNEVLNDDDILAEHPAMEEMEFPETDSSKTKSDESDKEVEGEETKVKTDSSENEDSKEKAEETPAEETQEVHVVDLKTAVEQKLEEAIAAEKEKDGEELKKKRDSSLGEKFERRKVDLLMKLYGRCETEKKVDFDFIREEIMHVMRLEKVPGAMEVPVDGGRIPRIKRMVLVVEEGFPVFLQTKLDGFWIVSCLGHDTLKFLRQRFAKLLKIENPNDLVLRRNETNGLFDPEDADEQTLDDLKIEAETMLHGHRIGEQRLKIVFNFSISVDMRVNYCDSFANTAKMLALRHVPDIINVRFDFWYQGHTLNMECFGDRIVGQEIMGFHYLRVMIIYDPDLGYEVDPKPQVRVHRVPRVLPSREGKTMEEYWREVVKLNPGVSEEEYQRIVENALRKYHNCSPSQVLKVERLPGDRVLRLDVNKRAKRLMAVRVERQLPERDESMKHSIPQQDSFLVRNLTLCMTVADLKQRLYKHTQEPPEFQSLTIDGKTMTSDDDYRSLRSLEFHKVYTIYMEPSIKIRVVVGNWNQEFVFPGYTTRFEKVMEMVEREFHIPMEQCCLEYKGVIVIPSFCLSDYGVKNGDEIKYIKPFQLDIWSDAVLYRQYVWPHTSPQDIWDKVSREANFGANSVICSRDLTKQLQKTKPTLDKCGIRKDTDMEILRETTFKQRVAEKKKEPRGHTRVSKTPHSVRKVFGEDYVPSSAGQDSEDDDPDYEEGQSFISGSDEDSDDDEDYIDAE